LQTEQFGKVGLLGSGLKDFERFFIKPPKLPDADNISMNALQRSIAFGLAMSGSFLRIELEFPESLQQFYGGGYEIAVSELGKFKKLDDITYLFWRIEVDGKDLRGNLVPSRAFRYSYNDDLLRIRTVTFARARTGLTTREQLFLVPPVYRDVRTEESADQSRPSLNARWLCNYFLVHDGSGLILRIYAKVAYQPQEKRWVRFEDSKDGVTVAVAQNFLEDTGREILRELGR
jgi:hypothetical protein